MRGRFCLPDYSLPPRGARHDRTRAGGPSAIGTNSGKLLLLRVVVTRVPNYSARFCGTGFVALVLSHPACRKNAPRVLRQAEAVP